MFQRRLSITNDSRVQRSIRNKRLAAELEEHIPKVHRNTKMFEQFLILGAPPSFETKNPEPVILSSYPRVSISSRPDNEVKMLISFCFPNGFFQIRRDATGLRTILSEFVFFLKEESDTLYGICLHFRGNDNLFFATEKNLDYPFCYCLLTTTPFFSSHFTFLSYFSLLMVDRIRPLPHINNSDMEVLLPAINEKLFASLELDEQFSEIAVYPGIKATQAMRDELSFYYSLPTKIKDRKVYPKIPLSSKITLFLPLHLSKNQCLAYSSFHTLFNLLKIPDIVTIYTALLLEMHIVFISRRDLHLLTMSLIAILSLLKPFKTRAMTILPILPSRKDFLQILDSPVPYIIGTASSTKDADLIVNIDSFEVIANTRIPSLPNRNNLIKKLTAIIHDNQQVCSVPQKRFSISPNDNSSNKQLNKEYLDFIARYNPYNFPVIYISLMKLTFIFPPTIIELIIDAFRSNIIPYMSETIHGCFVTDATDPSNPVTVCNNGLFLCQVPNRDREFYEKFIQTDIWETFCDKLSKPIVEFKKSQSSDFRDMNHESESEKNNSDNSNKSDKPVNNSGNTN
ncbi:hypothetical protein M9Y10_013402 [Tritrichomonas musculus]|uniref:UDENN domain-containing protein n=1 Tax=Tritrichomonas musculus TaxID=1915356 RepID=A0ABR2I7A2_9EUKA